MLMKTHSQSVLGSNKDRNDLSRRLELQGECRIKQTLLLELSYLKTAIFFIPVVLSIIGLLIIKHYKSARVKLFYWQATPQSATHIYVQGLNQLQQEIVPIGFQQARGIFFYKKLKYEWLNYLSVPMGLNYEKQLAEQLDEFYLKNGLDNDEVQRRRAEYGKNEHIVQAPLYFEYLYEVMTEPFFFLQYLAAVIYIIEKLSELAFVLLGASIITTSINYILLYLSYRKIKEIAERVSEVQVIREGKLELIPSDMLVPGDLFIPKQQLCCDVILLRGEVYVNEANLTGESVPIGKFPLQSFYQWDGQDSSKWMYEGSKILSSNSPLAIVIHVGYSTKRGRILRKILNRSVTTSHLFVSCLCFLTFTFVIAVIAYLATMKMRLDNNNLDGIIIFLNSLLLVTQCFPPGCPIYFNLVYSCCLMRLKWNNILGTQPEKAVQSAHLKVMCFDKTGTLTKDTVEVHRILRFRNNRYQDITQIPDKALTMDYKILGSCHTVRQYDGKMMGDEIDLKMFLHSGYQLIKKSKENSCFQVQTLHNVEDALIGKHRHISVLKVFQYQSKFQSMSVLVHDSFDNKYYVFVKGAPEKIHYYSIEQYNYFDQLLQNVSYGGFRCIAYGYKEVKADLVREYMQETRQNYLKRIHLLGFAVFQNEIKPDAKDTIDMLGQAGIQSKIITGDNIYIAIQTGIRCGIVSRDQEMIVLEGNSQGMVSKELVNYQTIFNAKIMGFQSEKVSIINENISYQSLINSNRPIVIDNSFLEMTSSLQPLNNVKIYSRISPQNKAFIVKKLRKNMDQKFKNKSRYQKIFINQRDKVGMTGDGANDLLAIKQADIGIGIKSCDSSYAASFSIESLLDIGKIICEAKCGQRQIMQIVRFVHIQAFASVPLLIIMQTQAAFFNSFQLIFGNITKYIILNLLLALSRPKLQQTKYKPCSNFMSTQHQFVFWGNVIILTLGHLGITIYFRGRPEYSWNTSRATFDSGWVTNTSLVSANYLLYTVHPIVLAFSIYVSQPFKLPIYKNFLLFLVLILNTASTLLMFLLFPQLSSIFTFVTIQPFSLFIIGMICLSVVVATLIYNFIINSLALHQKNNSLCPKQNRPQVWGRTTMTSSQQN